MKWLGLLLTFGLLVFLTFNRHSKSGYFNYHSEIWGDKAGYYVYLPAAFKYDFKAHLFPDSISVKTGDGFKLDLESDKVISKYTYGVALMQAPFYWLADVLASPLGQKADGFSPVYHWSINLAAVFYFSLGFFFLWRVLRMDFSAKTSALTLASIFLATNLYYYAIDETGMSHIYSFALFCFALYGVRHNPKSENNILFKTAILGFIVGLILVIRPTNIVFILALFFLDIQNFAHFKSRLAKIFHFHRALPLLFGVVVAVLPQLLYWKYSSGEFLQYSYGEESFNWLRPKLLNVWFSTNNGLFTYTPFFIIKMLAMVLMIRDKVQNGVLYLLVFLLCSYIFASWWVWFFGCAFGARSFTEYLALFSLPLAYLIAKVHKLSRLKQFSLHLFLAVCIMLNLVMTYNYDSCYYGQGSWDWAWYFGLLSK